MPENWTAGVASQPTDTRRIKWAKILLRYGGTPEPTDTVRQLIAKVLAALVP